jgi:nicotinamide-nucleotide amidase
MAHAFAVAFSARAADASRVHIEILHTGSELLLGRVLNTHGAWLGMELFKLGLRVQRQTTVPDGSAIRDALAEILPRADAVIVTGGLGPTSDDVTRECTAELLDLPLATDERALRSLEQFFAIRNRPMAAANLKQALVPAGAEVLPNPNGTAPGLYLSPGLQPGVSCAVFLLPGPPRELHPMFRAEVVPRLAALAGGAAAPACLDLRFTGIGESDFHQTVDAELATIPGLEVGYCARIGEVDLRLIGPPQALASGRKLVEESFAADLVSDDGSSLEETVVRMLAERRLRVATAESCTGGLIAHRLTNVPGASEVFTHGFVTYANAAKTAVLGVPEELLATHGAVSEPVARAMAEGALRVSGADLAVAVTGIAGPGGGTPAKPPGTAWLAVARRGSPTSAQHLFQPRQRLDFKQGVSQSALDAIRRSLATEPARGPV